MDDTDTLTWLIFARAPTLTPAHVAQLRDGGRTLAGALAAGIAWWRHCALPPATIAWLERPDRVRLDADLAWLARPGRHLIGDDDPRYPPQLREVADAPPALFVVGDPWLLWRAQLAIVGARNASAGGAANARGFAQAAVRAGLAITSGLARGIDGAAHAAALDAGGTTIAVCGTGLDIVYPRAHVALAERIAADGALVSEFPPGTVALPNHFPRRNRILSALALGTLVIEAGLQSGSLITARLAAEQGREVFALPGSIHHPLARGCHRLLRDGARLVEDAEEVIAALAPAAQRQGQAIRDALQDDADASAIPVDAPDDDAPTRRRVLAALGHDPVSADEIVARSGLTAAAVSAMLLALELEGAVAAAIDGRFARVVPVATRSHRAGGVGR